MIDYIKATTKEFDFEYLVNNFDFYSEINEKTGEIKTNKYGTSKRILKYQGLVVIIFENLDNKKTLLIEGSLHIYWNNGKHNFNDFTQKDIQSIVLEMGKKFKISPANLRLHNLEIGFNIIPPTNSIEILRGLISHRNKPFKTISKNNAEYYQSAHYCFYIKVYDKRLQYIDRFPQISSEILRYEIKYTRMRDINNLVQNEIEGNYLNLMHLTNPKILKVIGLHSLKYWNAILFYDYSIDVSKLSEEDYINTLLWQNFNQWASMNKVQKHLKMNRLLEITKDYSDNLQDKINNSLHKKLEILLT